MTARKGTGIKPAPELPAKRIPAFDTGINYMRTLWRMNDMYSGTRLSMTPASTKEPVTKELKLMKSKEHQKLHEFRLEQDAIEARLEESSSVTSYHGRIEGEDA